MLRFYWNVKTPTKPIFKAQINGFQNLGKDTFSKQKLLYAF